MLLNAASFAHQGYSVSWNSLVRSASLPICFFSKLAVRLNLFVRINNENKCSFLFCSSIVLYFGILFEYYLNSVANCQCCSLLGSDFFFTILTDDFPFLLDATIIYVSTLICCSCHFIGRWFAPLDHLIYAHMIWLKLED